MKFPESHKDEQERIFLNEIEWCIDKLQEPLAVKAEKPLFTPIDPERKKRGRPKHRKMKERLDITQVREQRNNTKFGYVRHLTSIALFMLFHYSSRSKKSLIEMRWASPQTYLASQAPEKFEQHKSI